MTTHLVPSPKTIKSRGRSSSMWFGVPRDLQPQQLRRGWVERGLLSPLATCKVFTTFYPATRSATVALGWSQLPAGQVFFANSLGHSFFHRVRLDVKSSKWFKLKVQFKISKVKVQIQAESHTQESVCLGKIFLPGTFTTKAFHQSTRRLKSS